MRLTLTLLLVTAAGCLCPPPVTVIVRSCPRSTTTQLRPYRLGDELRDPARYRCQTGEAGTICRERAR